MTELCSDFNTIYNFRRELFEEKKFEKFEPDNPVIDTESVANLNAILFLKKQKRRETLKKWRESHYTRSQKEAKGGIVDIEVLKL